MGLDRPIDITADERKTLLTLIKRHLPNTTAWAYGSRVKWTSRPQSDLDLVVFTTPDQERRVSDLKEAFEESNLPFRVDLFVWDAVPEQFRKQIEAEHVVLLARDGESFERTLLGAPGNWIEATVDDIAASSRNAIVGGPFGSNLVSRDYVPEGVPVIRGQNMGNRWVAGDFVFVTPQKAESLEANLARPGDIVLTQRGTLGQVSLVPLAPFGSYLVSQSQMKVTVNREIADPIFFYYVLSSVEQQDYVRQNAIQTGVPHTNLGMLRSTPVLVPSLEEQHTIAHVLGTLDDKIELNRRMNETLEAMARALFKSWFIDFDPVLAKAALRNHSPLEGESAKAPSEITPPLRGSRRDKGASTQMSRWGAIKRFYTQQTLQKAQTLRESQTNAEGLLWHYLRDKQLAGYKFRRQQPIGPYIVDFACMPQKLLIELDGGQHAEQHTYDKKRDEFLREKGYKILRFWNNDVFENCFGVLESIRAAVQDPPPQQSAPKGLTTATPPQGGSDWSVERARAYLDRMPQHLADLFPDRLVDSELGPIPEGWEVVPLPEIIAINPTRSLQKGEVAPYLDMANMPTRGHAPDILIDRPFGSGMRFANGDTLVARITPCLENGKTAYVDFLKDGEVGWGSTEYMVMRPKLPLPNEFAYCLARSVSFREFAIQNMTGTSGRQRVPAMALSQFLLPSPPKQTAAIFGRVAQPLFARASEAVRESRALAALRDALLPKLISGEIRAAS